MGVAILNHEVALSILASGTAAAARRQQRVAVAVVDAAGAPVATVRMDGTLVERERLATGKAFGALILGQPTSSAATLRTEAPIRYEGLLSFYAGRIYLVAGGVPIIDSDGRLVGGLGVAGGRGGADEPIAYDALASTAFANHHN